MSEKYILDKTIVVDSKISGQSITREGFGTVLLVVEDASFPLVHTFVNADDVAETVGDNTSLYKWASVFFGQNPNPQKLKVVSKIGVDYKASLETVMGDVNQDKDWFMVGIESTNKDEIVKVAEWAELNDKMFVALSIDNDNYDSSNQQSVRSILKEKKYNNTMLIANLTSEKQVMKLTFSVALVKDNIVKGTLNTNKGTFKVEIPFDKDEDTTIKALSTQLKGFDGVSGAVVSGSTGGKIISVTMNENVIGAFIGLRVEGGASKPTITNVVMKKGVMGNSSRTDAFFLANRSVRDSGVTNPAYQEGRFVDYTNLSDIQVAMLFDNENRLNGYISLGGRSYMYQGIMASGLYFDTVRANFEIQQRIKEDYVNFLLDNEKVGYTNHDINKIIGVSSSRLAGYEQSKVITEGSVIITAPDATEITQDQRANRVFGTIDIKFLLNTPINRLAAVGGGIGVKLNIVI